MLLTVVPRAYLLADVCVRGSIPRCPRGYLHLLRPCAHCHIPLLSPFLLWESPPAVCLKEPVLGCPLATDLRCLSSREDMSYPLLPAVHLAWAPARALSDRYEKEKMGPIKLGCLCQEAITRLGRLGRGTGEQLNI